MSSSPLRSLTCVLLAPTAILLPHFAQPGNAASLGKDCYGKVCHAVEEFCSTFTESCDKCENICDRDSHNYQADMCARECAEYNKYEPLKADIHAIQTQQNVILLLLIVLLLLILARYGYKLVRWLRQRQCCLQLLKKLHLKKFRAGSAGIKDLNGAGATTIQNVMAINEVDRAPSQIYSVTGAEGSVMTMTTPVSTRYPAENSTTPTNNAPSSNEYSYDNQALAVTPVSEKPRNKTQAF